jgi:hypothetical protein
MTDAFDPVAFLERAVATPSAEDVDAMRELLVETLTAAGVETTVDDAGSTPCTEHPRRHGYPARRVRTRPVGDGRGGRRERQSGRRDPWAGRV